MILVHTGMTKRVSQLNVELDLFLRVCAVFHVLPPLLQQSGPSGLLSTRSRCQKLSTIFQNLFLFLSLFHCFHQLFFSQLPFSPSPTLSVTNWTSHMFWTAPRLAGRIQEVRMRLAGAAFCCSHQEF